MEVWRWVKGYEGIYKVSNIGNVMSMDNRNGRKPGYIKKLYVGKRGYKVTDLKYQNRKRKNVKVHRIVAEAFIDNPLSKPQVNHINGDKHDNRVHNLEWATAKENTRHAIKNGLLVPLTKNHSYNMKYSNEQCQDVIRRVKSGMKYAEAGEIYSMPYSTVAHLIRGSRRQYKELA